MYTYKKRNDDMFTQPRSFRQRETRPHRLAQCLAILTFITLLPGTGTAGILWSGDFNEGSFAKYSDDPGRVSIHGVPPYGKPVQYGGQADHHVGNGDLMWLTADSDSENFRHGPRLGNHAVGLHVKSWAGGSVDAQSTDVNTPGDWDGARSDRRRTELRAMTLHYDSKLIPYMTTRWASASIFVPEDWDTENGSGVGVVTWQWKPKLNNGSMSPPISVRIRNGQWQVLLHTNPNENPRSEGWTIHNFEPSLKDSIHYPDPTTSINMLSNLNKGEWTHFIIQLRLDGRLSTEGGTGLLNLWMRHGDGSWAQVLNFFPTPNYGVLFKQSGEDALFGFHVSLYMQNSQVLDLPGPGRTLYYDNVKIGDEHATLADMSHDGSASGSDMAQPRAPDVEVQ